MQFSALESAPRHICKANDKSADLRRSADDVERLITECRPSRLTHDQLRSIAGAEHLAGREIALYLSTAKADGAAALRADIAARRRRLRNSEESKFYGLLESDGVHTVAVHGLITKDRAALVAVDSRESDAWSYEPADHMRHSRNTAMHWILSSVQKDSSSCAVFAIAAARALRANASHFEAYLRRALPQADTLAPHESREDESSQPEYLVFGDSSDEESSAKPECDLPIVSGEQILPPDFYRYAQSRATVKNYCIASPIVQSDPRLGEELVAFHERHRRAIVAGSRTITANHAIIGLQAQLLREAAAFEERATVKIKTE